MYHCMYFMYYSSVRAQTHLIAFPLLFLSPFLLFFSVFFCIGFNGKNEDLPQNENEILHGLFYSRDLCHASEYIHPKHKPYEKRNLRIIYIWAVCVTEKHTETLQQYKMSKKIAILFFWAECANSVYVWTWSEFSTRAKYIDAMSERAHKHTTIFYTANSFFYRHRYCCCCCCYCSCCCCCRKGTK